MQSHNKLLEFAIMDTTSANPPGRRLRRKTTVGQLAVLLAAVAPAALPALAEATWQDSFLKEEELEPEGDKKKSVYLVTFPHPQESIGPDVTGLRAPGDFTHKDIIRMLIDVFAHPAFVDAAAASRGPPTLTLQKMVVFRELHAADAANQRAVHYHVALCASGTFRWAPYKRAMREKYGLATHWSDSHDGYWSAVRYGTMWTPKKPQEEIDKDALPWCLQGTHRSLFDSAQEPNTAAATRRRREYKVKKASQEGKSEPRADELDLYAVVVREGFRNTADDPWAAKKLINHLQEYGGQGLWQVAWRMRSRLSALIDDVWSWETVSDDLRLLGQTRLETFHAAARGQCVCRGAWRQAAEYVLQANGLDPQQLCGDIYRAIVHGRHESLPVLCLVGRFGGEGKSFFFAPLKKIFGAEHVQATPQPGNFPLFGLETKRCVLLDEWDFNGQVVPLSTQLLWFEGKAFPITRPQNKDYVGHVLYQGSAPIFVTCKEKVVLPIYQRAQLAYSQNQASPDTMLLRRLKLHWLNQKLPLDPGTIVHECPACFAQMVLQHSSAQQLAV